MNLMHIAESNYIRRAKMKDFDEWYNKTLDEIEEIGNQIEQVMRN